MIIKILGSGCSNCQRLEANTRKAVAELGIEATIEHVTDYKDIVSYGVMKTPALVVDGKLKLSGKVPSSDEIKNYL
jgi:small redox-active disulfide protein 2